MAIVGRPNVGKSTLLNRLAGGRLAVVDDVPGVTRDRHYADAMACGRQYILVDTGGFDPSGDDPMAASIAGHVRIALAEADVVVCVLDATADPLTTDREAVTLLRSTAKPVIYVANKVDSPRNMTMGVSLYELGVERIVRVSALHGHGTAELDAAIADNLPEQRVAPAEAEAESTVEVPRVAIVGRPNAGKSSLVNRLLGQERVLVDDRPGTTVDSIDALCERDGRRLVLVDTAGIRRRQGAAGAVEGLAALQAIRAIERSDSVVLTIDATAGATEQDARIAGIAEKRGRAFVVALNKIDRLDAAEQRRAINNARDVLCFVPWSPIVGISARTGRGLGKLLDTIARGRAAHARRVGTAELNKFFEDVISKHPPPTMGAKSVRLFYVTQVGTEPPTFVAVASHPEAVHRSYQRYVANRIREHFGFEGTPVRVLYRGRRRRER